MKPAAIIRPMPREPPVMRAVRPLRENRSEVIATSLRDYATLMIWPGEPSQMPDSNHRLTGRYHALRNAVYWGDRARHGFRASGGVGAETKVNAGVGKVGMSGRV